MFLFRTACAVVSVLKTQLFGHRTTTTNTAFFLGYTATLTNGRETKSSHLSLLIFHTIFESFIGISSDPAIIQNCGNLQPIR